MTTTVELFTYGVVFAVTLIFTLVSISDRKDLHFKLFAAVCWFIFSVVHFIMGDKTSALTYAISMLWLGLGLVFTVWSISAFFTAKKEKVWSFEP